MKTEDASREIWSSVVIWPCGLTHLCTKKNVGQTIADLEGRGCPVSEVAPVKGPWVLDMPGMMWMGRQMVSVRIDSLELSIPATEVGLFLLMTRNLQERTFSDGTRYYKLKGFTVAVVLDPEQRDALQKALEISYESAKEKAEEDVYRQYEIQKELGETGYFSKVKLMSNDTSKN